MLARQSHHNWVDADELQNVDHIGQPVVVEAHEEASDRREPLATLRIFYQTDLERKEKGKMHGREDGREAFSEFCEGGQCTRRCVDNVT